MQNMPSNVALFERLMYLSLGIGVIVSLLTWNQNVTTAQAVGGAAFVFFVQAFTFAFIVLFIWLIARRRNNWARWFLLDISILGLPFSLRMLGRMLLSNPIASTDMLLFLVGTLNFAQLMAELVAFFLIFTGNARAWFAPSLEKLGQLSEIEEIAR